MNSNKALASLCYFSIFFAGFIFPMIVYFVTDQRDVKHHAKKAFLSHLIPFFTIVFFVILSLVTGAFQQTGDAILGMIFVGVIIAGIINFIVVIWNIVKGIKVLKES
jgi:hypothetical protein